MNYFFCEFYNMIKYYKMDFYNRRRFDRCGWGCEPFWCEPRFACRREPFYGHGYPYWGNRYYNSPIFFDNYYYY